MTSSAIIKEKAPQILAEIKKAKNILLHCHPSPDPDSVGSALAMKFAIEQLGKKVTVIKGDSEIPQAFHHFPGAKSIESKNFFEADLTKFDLFIVQDSASLEMISRRGEVKFPASLKVIVIDHHKTNLGFGSINLIDASYPATAQILFDLFQEWDIKITPEIAPNIFMGMYTDTGGFKYSGTSERTFLIAAELIKIIPNFSKLISDMENTNTPEYMAFHGKALSSIETFLNNKVAIATVPNAFLKEKNISSADSSAGSISSILRTVASWDIVVGLVEVEPNKCKTSFRSHDPDIIDVSKIAAALGGGGHKVAAGASIDMPPSDAKKAIVTKIKELYNL